MNEWKRTRIDDGFLFNDFAGWWSCGENHGYFTLGWEIARFGSSAQQVMWIWKKILKFYDASGNCMFMFSVTNTLCTLQCKSENEL